MDKHFDLSVQSVNFRKMPFELYQVFMIFVVPVALIYFGVIPDQWRLFVLVVGGLFIYGIVKKEKWSMEMLGLNEFHTERALKPYVIFTVVGIFFLIGLAYLNGFSAQVVPDNYLHLLFLFLPVSALQEFAYRGYLMPVLHFIYRSPVRVVIINTLLFTFLHVIYPDMEVNLPLAFVSGLGFAMMYYRYPNLILISISHAILNFVAILYGFFIIPPHF